MLRIVLHHGAGSNRFENFIESDSFGNHLGLGVRGHPNELPVHLFANPINDAKLQVPLSPIRVSNRILLKDS